MSPVHFITEIHQWREHYVRSAARCSSQVSPLQQDSEVSQFIHWSVRIFLERSTNFLFIDSGKKGKTRFTVVRCLSCGQSKTFLNNPDHCLWVDRPEAQMVPQKQSGDKLHCWNTTPASHETRFFNSENNDFKETDTVTLFICALSPTAPDPPEDNPKRKEPGGSVSSKSSAGPSAAS